MYLYSAVLVINDCPITYQVSLQDKLLLFKPESAGKNSLDTPIFWATREEGEWKLLNVKDEAITRQAVEGILKNYVDVAG